MGSNQLKTTETVAAIAAKKAKADADRVSTLKSQGLDARGLPLRPEFADIFQRGADKQSTDKLREGFQIGQFDDVNLDRRALDRITEEGLSEGITRGGQRQLDAQALDQQRSFDDFSRGNAGAQAQAQNQLASQGGLSGGARERLARAGSRNALLGRQDIRGAGARDRAGILASDEQAKRGLLGQAQQGALQAGQFDQGNRQFEAQRRQFDISNSLNELQSKRDADLRAFEADRKAAAAEKSAEAQRASSCFAEGTMLPMADKTYKKIEDVKIGDTLMCGGTVHLILAASLADEHKLYDYEGILVTGGHAVYEDKKWVRIEDSRLAVTSSTRVNTVYSVANELHLVTAAGIMFADYEETDDFHKLGDDESLEALNALLNEKVEVHEQEQPLC